MLQLHAVALQPSRHKVMGTTGERELCGPGRSLPAAVRELQSRCQNGAGGGELASIRDEPWVKQAVEHAGVETWFHALVRAHFKGHAKPPFNVAARAAAGFTPAWYEPLCTGVAAGASSANARNRETCEARGDAEAGGVPQ